MVEPVGEAHINATFNNIFVKSGTFNNVFINSNGITLNNITGNVTYFNKLNTIYTATINNTVTNIVKIDSNAFNGNNFNGAIKIHSNIIDISSNAFNNCSNL